MRHFLSYTLPTAAALAFCAMGAQAQVADDTLAAYVGDCMLAFETDLSAADLDGFERVSESLSSKTYPALPGAPLQAEPRVMLQQADGVSTCTLASFEGAIDDVKTRLPEILVARGWASGGWMTGRTSFEVALTLSKQDAIVLVQLTDQRGLFAGIIMYQLEA